MVSTKCSSDTEYKRILTGEAETQFISVGYKGTSRSRPSFCSVQSDAKVEEEDKERNEVDQSGNAQERRDMGTVCRGTCRVSSSKKQAGRCGGEVEGLPHLPACFLKCWRFCGNSGTDWRGVKWINVEMFKKDEIREQYAMELAECHRQRNRLADVEGKWKDFQDAVKPQRKTKD